MTKVRVVVKNEGKVEIDWEGFKGDACYLEAQKLYSLLKGMGVDVEVKQITPKMVEMGEEKKVHVADREMELGGW